MANQSNKRYIHQLWEFDDFDEFLTELEVPLTMAQRKAWSYHPDDEVPEVPSEKPVDEIDADRWYGSQNWDEGLNFARGGWSHGFEEFSDKLDTLSPYVSAAVGVQSEDFAPAGYMPHVPAFCAGSPACMYTQGETYTARTPVLRFLVHVGANSHVNGESFIRRGAALCAVIDYFESIGTRCEVELVDVAYAAGRDANGKLVNVMIDTRIPAKRAEEAIEPDRFAFMLCNPTVQRRFLFRLEEKVQAAGPYMRGMYGTTKDAEPDVDQIYIPQLENFYSDEDALRHVLERVSEYLEPEYRERISEDWAEVINYGVAVGR